ncbi:MAG: septal ring lytic transglycosylase RlpA family protein [Hyphomicrobiaceae bacterium]
MADGWADSTAYRNLSWSGSTHDVGKGRTARRASVDDDDDDDDDAPVRASRTKRRARTVEASNDGDRPQRRARTARAKSRSNSESGSSGGGSTGLASYYWQPQRVASGGWFNPNAMTAAHKTLPFGTRVRVTNISNGRSTVVTINDRGPYIAGRVIDLSRAAAQAINMTSQGVARVRMQILGR